ncbi:peptidoglycan DD-metalloendopeptidase family protein [Aggregatilinea lenta]|uniref:peptidoglycan DD-metalloendopeptidase family protein n=1 Tax=Aggregatilinea lenta TaxID=913108 RepID=UPI0013C2A87A|nr:M23 family metallopeptidase [Aggregatilinea lenta]
MIDEPEISLEDTNPHEPVSLDERLRNEEPPLSSDDTNPSSMVRQDPPRSRASQIVAALMLIGALVLTMGATVIWLTSEESDVTPEPTAQSVVQDAAPTATVRIPPTDAPAEDDATALPAQAAGPRVYSTPAADEIAAALLTPVPQQPVAYVITRANDPFTIQSQQERTEVVQYTVQQGDTLESVASKFGLNDFYTIIWSNSRNSINPMRPGVQINIMPVDGVYYEVTENMTIGQLAEKYDVDPYAIIDSEYNNTVSFSLFGSTEDTLLTPGMKVVIPGAKGEQMNLLAANTSNAGAGSSGSVSGSYSLWGCTANVSGGTLPVNNPLSAGYTWMQGFIPGAHEGVDLSPSMGTGTPVGAAGAGTVVYAGWSSYGYGNVVVVAHGVAFTVYAHLNGYSVRCGQNVSAGQQIGQVGSTGNSSGPHLHFEVRDANFNPRNPQDYVSF